MANSTAPLPNFNKGRADGKCGCCGKPVPATNGNKFYCSDLCRQAAWNHHHPVVSGQEDDGEY